jgi:hypothetical protein
MASAQRLGGIRLDKAAFDRCSSVLRLAVGVAFIAASIPKIERPFDFLSIVYDYSLVGPTVGLFIAKTVPWLELMIGLCLVTRVLEDGALVCGGVLLLMFAIAQSVVLRRGSLVPCGCFSVEGTPIEWKDVALSGCLAVLTFGLLIIGRRSHPSECVLKSSIPAQVAAPAAPIGRAVDSH